MTLNGSDMRETPSVSATAPSTGREQPVVFYCLFLVLGEGGDYHSCCFEIALAREITMGIKDLSLQHFKRAQKNLLGVGSTSRFHVDVTAECEVGYT